MEQHPAADAQAVVDQGSPIDRPRDPQTSRPLIVAIYIRARESRRRVRADEALRCN